MKTLAVIALLFGVGSAPLLADIQFTTFSDLVGNGHVAFSGKGLLQAVPDGGTTLALLGLAVAGMAGFRRKLGR